MAITAASEIKSESLPDAPDEEWWDNYIKFDNERGRQLVAAVNSQRETALVDVDLIHGSITQRANPLSVPIAGIYPVRCFGVNVDATTLQPNGGFYSLGLPQIEWHPTTMGDGSVWITPSFPLTIDNAIGEILGPITRLRANSTGLTSPNTTNVCTTTSITLTPGSWNVRGAVSFAHAGTTNVTKYQYGISATSGTLPSNATIAVPTNGEIRFDINYGAAGLVPAGDVGFTLPSYRVTVATGATLPLYLVAAATFTVSTASVWGWMEADRVVNRYALDSPRGRVRLLFIGEQ